MSLLYNHERREIEYGARVLTDLSRKVDDWDWKSNDFLAYTETPICTEPNVPKEVFEKVNEGISELLGRKVETIGYSRNPMTGIVVDCYRIEGRKEFVAELEKIRQNLEGMLQKPHNKRMEKSIMHRLKKLQKRIDDHKLGCEHVFLTEEEVKKFMRQNNVNLRLFEYTTIIPLMEIGEKYEAALDVLEKAGVPNTHLLRGFGESTREAFFGGWMRNFVPYASVYLMAYREKAIEDVMRRLPAVSSGGEFAFTANPDLGPIVLEERVQKTIKELGLPLEETTGLLSRMYEMCRYLDNLKHPVITAARDFYRAQLNHSNQYLRWIAVRALADSCHLPEPKYYDMPTEEDKKKWKKDQKREYASFRGKELENIISSLRIKERLPVLAEHKPLLADRFLRFHPYRFDGDDPYDLKVLERLIPLSEKVNSLLDKYSHVRLDLENFLDIDNSVWRSSHLEGLEKSYLWMAENLGKKQYGAMAGNEFFCRTLKEGSLYQHLKDKPANVEHYFGLIKRASAKLEKISKNIGRKHAKRLYDCVFRDWDYAGSHTKDHTLAFIELFADADIKNKSQLNEYYWGMKELSDRLSRLSKEERREVLKDFRAKKMLQNTFELSDYFTRGLFVDEIASLKAKSAVVEEIMRNSFFPTQFLADRYSRVKDKKKEMMLWKKKAEETANGKFNPKDRLMVELEYTNFRRFVNSATSQPEEFDYDNYKAVISSGQVAAPNVERIVANEIEYLCLEAHKLLKFLRQLKKQGDAEGRPTLVVPNYSYGILAILPIQDILKDEGFEIATARVGSSECHETSHYIKGRLFLNGINKKILKQRPNIVVVDGTWHLDADETHKTGRYPDSYQGYVNYIAIINDILTKNNQDAYAKDVFRAHEDIEFMRGSREYEFARGYIESGMDKPVETDEHYSVCFWNPAGLRLAIREKRQNKRMLSASAKTCLRKKQPKVVIVNSVMPGSAMPKELVERLGEHSPAYFDDGYAAHAIAFKTAPTGVKYSNVLEENIKEMYKSMFPSAEARR